MKERRRERERERKREKVVQQSIYLGLSSSPRCSLLSRSFSHSLSSPFCAFAYFLFACDLTMPRNSLTTGIYRLLAASLPFLSLYMNLLPPRPYSLSRLFLFIYLSFSRYFLAFSLSPSLYRARGYAVSPLSSLTPILPLSYTLKGV